MAHFRGSLEGNGPEQTRLGHWNMRTTCRGWDIGVRCEAVRCDTGDDIKITLDGGSNGYAEGMLSYQHVQGQGKREFTAKPHIRELHFDRQAARQIAVTDDNIAALLSNEALRRALVAKLWVTGAVYEQPVAA